MRLGFTLVAVTETAMLFDGMDQGWVPLNADESYRRAKMQRKTDQDDFIAVRALARQLLSLADSSCAPSDWVLTQHCDGCGGPHGRPVVALRRDLAVSWAHARGLVAAAVSDDPVGVDAEWLEAGRNPPFPDRRGSDHSSVAQWLRWTRMEALVKRGDGDLDSGLGWQLAGLAAPSGVPVDTLLPGHVGVLTDLVGPQEVWVASVAATSIAQVVTV